MKKQITIVCLMSFASCAVKQPSSRPVLADAEPSSLFVDFSAIPSDQCDPVLDGVFLSWDGARKLLIADAEMQAETRKKEIRLQAEIDALRLRAVEAEGANASAKWWATLGAPLGVVAGVLITIATFGVFGAVNK